MSSIDTWYLSLPPLTKSYLKACVITTVLSSLDIIDYSNYIFYMPFIYKDLEIWRLLTGFTNFGDFSYNWILVMAML